MTALTPRRWLRVKDVFHLALERPAGERSALVGEACGGDQDLRREVERLLASHAAAGSFIERPAVTLPSGMGLARAGALSGCRLGQYELDALLGIGGMGQVYRALDTELGRIVAIKVVDVPDAQAHARLRREARHASKLNHPNICTIHHVGDHEGRPYIVMELVDGRPLAETIPAEGLTPVLATAYAMQVADALSHAHEHSLVHRDLKSSNVMVTVDGRVKLLDFGLARRLADEPGGESEVSAWSLSGGGIAGTLGYMPPEVLRGQRADVRSDVWALGVLLYEMTTGTLPYSGRTAFELSSAILHDPPAPMPAAVPPALRRIVARCLEKEQAQRFQEAGSLKAALQAFQSAGDAVAGAATPPDRAGPFRRAGNEVAARARRARGLAARVPPWPLAAGGLAVALLLTLAAGWWPGAVPPAETSPARGLAVLPLTNLSGDPSQDFFADGLTEALIAELGKTTGLRVISRTTAMSYRESGKSLPEIGRELKVDAILEGSVLRTGNRVRVTARLFRAHSEEPLWAETHERTLREILVLQRDIVRAVSDRVLVGLTDQDRARLSVVRSVDPEVYEHYLKGRYHWNRRSEASLAAAVEHFLAATAADPTYAPAFVGLADSYNQLGTIMMGVSSPAEMRPKALAAALTALQIDDTLGEAHAALAYIKHYDWDWDAAERGFERAISLNPNYSLAHVWYGNYLMSMRRFDEAIAAVRHAQALDPLSRIVLTNVGWTLQWGGRSRDALDALRAALSLDPDFPQALSRMAATLADLSEFDAAIPVAERVAAVSGRGTWSLLGLAQIYARAGRRADAEALLAEVIATRRAGYVPPMAIAFLHGRLGNADAAFEWLERGYEERANGMVYLHVESSWDSIRHDPRFQDLVRRVGLPAR
jgi:eukaryotic-like serine/threonine-protein kinase